jgi:hypothetical protein
MPDPKKLYDPSTFVFRNTTVDKFLKSEKRKKLAKDVIRKYGVKQPLVKDVERYNPKTGKSKMIYKPGKNK